VASLLSTVQENQVGSAVAGALCRKTAQPNDRCQTGHDSVAIIVGDVIQDCQQV